MDVHTFLLMGRPGSGKGTQAKLLAQKIGGQILSPGAEYREMIARETTLGRRLKTAMEAGELMPTWLAIYMFEKELFIRDMHSNLIFESGCRIKPEAEAFDEVNAWLGRPYKVVYLDVSEEETKRRLLQRQQHENRADDHSIEKRIEEFRNKTTPSLEFFKSKGTLMSISGEQSAEKVQQDICQSLGL